MNIYKAEAAAGLSDLIRSTARVTHASVASLATPPPQPSLRNVVLPPKARATNEGQPDLHYLTTVLVSTGWNKNDDVFDRAEVWAARATPEDKPFNYEHDQADIIGHITGCYAADQDGNALGGDLAVDALPAAFDLVTPAVLYKVWEDQSLQDRVDRVIAEIPHGKWFVSMECLFSDFDYAVAEADGSERVVARNEKTAFLSKHLRAYGGDGTFDGRKVGRLLRRLTFAGKGLVRNPANPKSVILRGFDTVSAETVYPSPIPETSMSVENAELTSLRDQVKALQASLKDAESKNWAKQVEDLQALVKAKDEKIASLDEAAKALKNDKEKLEVDLSTAKTKLGDAEKDRDAARAEAAELKVKVAKAERVKTALDKFEDAARAENFVLKTIKLDDAEFGEALAALPVKPIPAQTNLPNPMGKGDGSPVKTLPGGTGSQPPEPAKTVKSSLDAAEPVAEPALAVAGGREDEKVEKTRAAIAKYLTTETEA